LHTPEISRDHTQQSFNFIFNVLTINQYYYLHCNSTGYSTMERIILLWKKKVLSEWERIWI